MLCEDFGWQVFGCQLITAQDYFLTHTAHEISCAYEPAAGLQARKVSLFTGREGSFYLISCLLRLTTTKKIDFV